ncbi:MAG: transposase family protein, partial [Candidatus Desulfofervidaceae bacterium]|nr:transposase family protein [Candidatus Desulfofervidaceae bacterium]
MPPSGWTYTFGACPAPHGGRTSRYIVHHELRASMESYDVEIVLQRALEKFSSARPRIISDNGSQFIARDFKAFIRHKGLMHVKTSVRYPESN